MIVKKFKFDSIESKYNLNIDRKLSMINLIFQEIDSEAIKTSDKNINN